MGLARMVGWFYAHGHQFGDTGPGSPSGQPPTGTVLIDRISGTIAIQQAQAAIGTNTGGDRAFNNSRHRNLLNTVHAGDRSNSPLPKPAAQEDNHKNRAAVVRGTG